MLTFINVQVVYKDLYLLPHKFTHKICLQKAQKNPSKNEQKKTASARKKKDPIVDYALQHRIFPTEMKWLLLILLDKV